MPERSHQSIHLPLNLLSSGLARPGERRQDPRPLCPFREPAAVPQRLLSRPGYPLFKETPAFPHNGVFESCGAGWLFVECANTVSLTVPGTVHLVHSPNLLWLL